MSRLRKKNNIINLQEFSFQTYLLITIALLVMILTILIVNILLNGIDRLSFNLITNYPSSDVDKAGMRPAVIGSLYTVGVAILIALPLGVATGLYLHEYGAKNKINKLIEMSLVNLAGVPSVIFGLVALSFLSYTLGFGRSIIVGSIALAFLVLPLIVVATIESARLVPSSHRLAAYALGANKYQVVFRIVLPRIIPGALTSSILAVSRALGEAAPILVISGLVFIRRDPISIFDEFTVMPLQIFNWISRPNQAFIELSASAIIVLLMILISLNVVAIYLRNKLQKRIAD
ncbi:MAG: phosphate transport system permease protein PstA [Candidatus Nitrosocaldaceae archaeon]|nr:MAG: phosphate transport system permease protein PstA [Candidatus Nitrosocaldaceae archaeon]